MTRKAIKEMVLTAFVISGACGAVFGQRIVQAESSEVVAPYDEGSASNAPDIIFSNLDSTAGDRYNSDPGVAFTVAGKSATGQTETWVGMRFIPKEDVQAKVLLAAIGYTSGTKLVNLGIYSDNEVTNSVGTLLPGGQGSTSQIPDLGGCCQLAKVTLAGEGVTLTAGTNTGWLPARIT